MELSTMVTGVSLSKVCSIKAFKGSDESKSITLNVRFDGVPLQAVFDKAVAGAVIQWQNGPGRGKYDEWSNGQVINIDFKSPGATAIDPKQAMIAQARSAGVDVTDKQALMTYIMSQIEGMN